MKGKLLAIVMIMGLSLSVFAQNGKYGATPEDSTECIKNLSLYGEFMKQKNTKDAYGPWQKACQICPKSTKNLYIHGERMLKEKLTAASKADPKDEARIKSLVDSLYTIYDMRIEHFGQRGKVLEKKGPLMLKYERDRAAEANEIMKEAIELQGDKVRSTTVSYYFRSKYYMFRNVPKEDKEGRNAARMETIKLYPEVNALIKKMLKAATDANNEKAIGQWNKTNADVDKIFGGIAKCEDLINIFTPLFEADPTNVEQNQLILGLLETRKCNDADLYTNVAIEMLKVNPTAAAAYAIGNKRASQGKCSEALQYLKQTIDLASEEELDLKEKACMEAAKCSYNMRSLEATRSYCRQALAINPRNGSAYILIGDAYAVSQFGDNECTQKSVYWAATDKYEKAKSVDGSVAGRANGKIGKMKAQYPDTEKCFMHSVKDGDTFHVGGWINEDTVVRTKE